MRLSKNQLVLSFPNPQSNFCPLTSVQDDFCGFYEPIFGSGFQTAI
jgi:hypothetical protein